MLLRSDPAGRDRVGRRTKRDREIKRKSNEPLGYGHVCICRDFTRKESNRQRHKVLPIIQGRRPEKSGPAAIGDSISIAHQDLSAKFNSLSLTCVCKSWSKKREQEKKVPKIGEQRQLNRQCPVCINNYISVMAGTSSNPPTRTVSASIVYAFQFIVGHIQFSCVNDRERLGQRIDGEKQNKEKRGKNSILCCSQKIFTAGQQ